MIQMVPDAPRTHRISPANPTRRAARGPATGRRGLRGIKVSKRITSIWVMPARPAHTMLRGMERYVAASGLGSSTPRPSGVGR